MSSNIHTVGDDKANQANENGSTTEVEYDTTGLIVTDVTKYSPCCTMGSLVKREIGLSNQNRAEESVGGWSGTFE